MRLIGLLATLFLVGTLVLGWTKEDYEIFDIVSELEAAEGKGTTFYSWLEIEPSASKNDIVKAYRKKSLELHPDKNVGGKDIEARFARLGLINEILRSPERRDRYNFFYKNGVPKWRGTGYYYSRYRPTLSHTLIFLVFLTSLFQLLVLRMNYSRDKKRVDYFYTTALALNKNGAGKREKFYDPNSTAGPEEQDVPEVVGRRVKVPMVQGHDMAGVLDLAVVNDQVYVPHEDGSLEPLSDLAVAPSFFSTWPFRIAMRLARSAFSHLPPSVQSSLPVSLRAHQQPIESESNTAEGFDVSPTNGSTSRSKQKPRSQGTDTPNTATSLSDSEEGDENDETPNGSGTEAKPKKKRGPGKAAGMRRRKMGMKK